MDPSKIPPMKTGFSTGSKGEDSNQLLVKRLVSAVTVLVSRAQTTACTYAEHAIASGSRSSAEVTWIDVAMALRCECRKFLEGDIEALENDMNDHESRLDAVLHEMGHGSLDSLLTEVRQSREDEDDGSLEADSDECEDEDSQDEVESEEDDAVEFEAEYSSCRCAECLYVNKINMEWNEWVPRDVVESMLKQKTDESIRKVMDMVR